ncbi:MAG: PKD domain-containing protein, partial [Bacteroidetes bacterium]|nr:PKD domain-containing protein [Bacteroidota bacterium]
MKKICISILAGLITLFFMTNYAVAQISKGGTPPSFKELSVSDDIDIHVLPEIDMSVIPLLDDQSEKNGTFLVSGMSVPVNLGIDDAGTWTTLRNGRKIWRFTLISTDAKALSVSYDNFWLPPGGQLFLYNKYKTQVIGAFTEDNNPANGIFASELIQGDEVTLEYLEPKYVTKKARIHISEVAHVFRNAEIVEKYDPTKQTGWGQSDACEVNVNCSPVGDPYQNQKNGVTEIWLKDGASWGWCSGTLVNNTLEDGTPYYLTAYHCGPGVSSADLAQWQFYFQYEATDCTTPGSEPSYKTITGATFRADGPTAGGSDFLLIELSGMPPASYTPYYNGWNRANVGSPSGASIHHPAGDIKKISTYTSTLLSSNPNIGGDQMAANSAWQVEWSSNTNGWGVTEGGSSGSPIFDNNGRQVGTLSGGSSYCTDQTANDYYGKFWYHWDQNGATDPERLKPWLDPGSTGVTTLNGYDPYSTMPPSTDFSVISPVTPLWPIPIFEGETVQYQDESWGSPTSWSWSFSGGTPNSSTQQNPAAITYNNAGLYDVSLTATNANGDSTVTATGFIQVIDPASLYCDTLSQFCCNPTIYTSAGGYVGGTNEYGCNAIAEGFSYHGPYNKVTGGRFWWAAANNGTSPSVTFVVWGNTGGAPGAILATKTIPLATIVNDYNGDGYTDVIFDADVIIPDGPFYIGFQMPGTAASGDTLAIVTNHDDDGDDDTGYSLYSGWETYAAWGMSMSNAIFPFACYDPDLPPVAAFSGTPTTVNGGNNVTFTDLSYGGTPTSWSWTFPGGTSGTSTQQNPVIQYNTPGIYDVELTVSNSNGSDTETKINYIKVVDPNSCTCNQLDHIPGSEVLYTTGGGYVAGNNEYGDLAKAEYFT